MTQSSDHPETPERADGTQPLPAAEDTQALPPQQPTSPQQDALPPEQHDLRSEQHESAPQTAQAAPATDNPFAPGWSGAQPGDQPAHDPYASQHDPQGDPYAAPQAPHDPSAGQPQHDPYAATAGHGYGQPQQQGYPTWTAGAPQPGPAPVAAAPRRERRKVSFLGAATAVAATALLAGTAGGAIGGLAADQQAGTGVVTLDGPPVERPEGSVAAIAGRAVPSVLTIRVGSSGRGGTGSGWVYDGKGHVVTNNHVVSAAGDDGTIVVELADGTRRDAELVGRDVSYDLAVLEVDPKGLKPLPVGNSDDVVVGDQVVAVGSPLGLDSTVTAGIVSALERPVAAGEQGDQSYISAIQTDAAINPGNSGGPLLNARGEVVGVNSAIAQIPGGARDSASGSIGVGFSIPSTQVRRTVDQLISTGEAVHPVIGVHLDTQYSGEGARVLPDAVQGTEPVVPDGPADKAGVEAGDVITKIDGRRVSDNDQLVVRIRAKAVGDTVQLTVQRDGRERQLTMTLEAAEED
ncbi:trypsin-like peptidase domain-containing protein [Janibacter melonis]|uniref:S1C family serine protease n=1 Tax=Janibacter melonis TaxID=262209 RepID=UPI001E59A9BD|nr:trypsin-like peptidase domain-containing protein [Janibacter melonis]MCB5990942.1 trypsin-like peptidase domain-containing protein [Janibacter melonis]